MELISTAKCLGEALYSIVARSNMCNYGRANPSKLNHWPADLQCCCGYQFLLPYPFFKCVLPDVCYAVISVFCYASAKVRMTYCNRHSTPCIACNMCDLPSTCRKCNREHTCDNWSTLCLSSQELLLMYSMSLISKRSCVRKAYISTSSTTTAACSQIHAIRIKSDALKWALHTLGPLLAFDVCYELCIIVGFVLPLLILISLAWHTYLHFNNCYYYHYFWIDW